MAARDGGDCELSTLLDFSINSGWNSAPSLLVTLQHVRTLFDGSLSVSTMCGMSLERKLPNLCYCRGSPKLGT